MKITKHQLRRIIREFVEGAPEWPGDDEFIEELVPFITQEMWPEASQLMYHYGFEYPDIQLDLDDSEWAWSMRDRH